MRVQVLKSGFDLDETWKIADAIDDSLAQKLDFAYSSNWGYLTACPTNTGTAMRGSVMLHLPALVMTKQINKVMNAISKLNFASRGFYGEGNAGERKFLSDIQPGLDGPQRAGRHQNIHGLICQVIEQEEQARRALILQNRPVLEDKIFRSYGVLRDAHIISSQETVELLSMVRLGVDLNIIKDVDRHAINELFLMIQPAHLQKLDGKKLSAGERDTKTSQSYT